jgi:serine/threonine protein kinase
MRIPGLSGRHAIPAERSGVMRHAPDPAALTGATVLGKYKIDSFIGEGSNAHVFVGHPVADPGRYVVVKRIKPHVQANPRFRQFFDNEVASMRRFKHPYAVHLHDATLDDPVGALLVLDYIPGVTLESLLNRHRRLAPDRVGRILGPLCHALQAAGELGIVHRDLKPANLMVVGADTPQESIRVMDFGFAGFSSKPHIQLAELTGKGQIFACGTPAYVSPEMVRADPVDHRGDIYSVGVMLFELLTGRLPFDVHSQEQMLDAHLHTPPPRFSRVGLFDLPRVEAVVHTTRTSGTSRPASWPRTSAGRSGSTSGRPPPRPSPPGDRTARSSSASWPTPGRASRKTSTSCPTRSRRCSRSGWRPPSCGGSSRTSAGWWSRPTRA